MLKVCFGILLAATLIIASPLLLALLIWIIN